MAVHPPSAIERNDDAKSGFLTMMANPLAMPANPRAVDIPLISLLISCGQTPLVPLVPLGE